MKSAICFFLVCCAFQIVVGGVPRQDFIKQHDQFVKQINDLAKPVDAAVQAAASAAKKKGINTGDCVESSSISLKTYVDPRIVELDNCRDAAFKSLNKQAADKCFNGVLDGFKKEAKQALASGLGCVKNCAHTDCSEDE